MAAKDFKKQKWRAENWDKIVLKMLYFEQKKIFKNYKFLLKSLFLAKKGMISTTDPGAFIDKVLFDSSMTK